MLGNQKDEQARLQDVYGKLKRTLDKVSRINDNNKMLINESLEMIQFEINLAQSVRSNPETANYNKGVYSSNNTYDGSGFDAKQ